MSALGRVLAALLLALLVAGAADARAWSWLGVRIRDLSEQEMDELASRHGIIEGFGVVIVEVIEDTPAARAGMRAGDIVVAFEGRPVTETRLLQRLIAQAPVDRDIRLTVLRTAGRKALPARRAARSRPTVRSISPCAVTTATSRSRWPPPTTRRNLDKLAKARVTSRRPAPRRPHSTRRSPHETFQQCP